MLIHSTITNSCQYVAKGKSSIRLNKLGWLLLFFCWMVVGLGIGEGFALDEDLAYKHFMRAKDLEREGNFTGALKEYQASWKLAELPEALLKMARLLNFYFNNNLKAVKFYRLFLKRFPDHRQSQQVTREMKKAKNQLEIEEGWKADLNELDPLKLVTPLPLLDYEEEAGKNVDKKSKLADKSTDQYTGMSANCLSCHTGVMGPKINMQATHPIGRIPTGLMDKTVPSDVRFYFEGKVICFSCHDPNIIHLSIGNQNKTYKSLRVNTGPNGEDLVLFCGMCHSQKVSPDSFRRMSIEEEAVEAEMELDRIGRDEGEFDDNELEEGFFLNNIR